MARIGDVIDHRYKIMKEIGRGGMSVVYLAADNRLQKNWVLKEFRHGGRFQQLAKESLLQEAFILKKLEHPRLPRIVDIVNTGDAIYIIRDYIVGEPLDKVIEKKGAQPQELVIEWFRQLLDVLKYMHSLTPTVVYRDLKPANIMLKPDGSIHLFDFGAAKEADDRTRMFLAIGTRGYAAPEQFKNNARLDARTDIYALGITIHYLLTGKNPTEPPFELLPIRQYNPFLSANLEAIITKCTQLSPDDRYNSCDEILLDLEKEQDDDAKRGSPKIIVVISSVAVGALAIILAVTLTVLNSSQAQLPNPSPDTYVAADVPSLPPDPTADAGTPTDTPLPAWGLSDYIQAVAVDESNGDAYLELLGYYRGQLSDNSGKIRQTASQLKENDCLYDEIMAEFSDSRLTTLKMADTSKYALVNYQLGLLVWDFYHDPDDKDLFQSPREAKGFFAAALLANPQTDEEYGLIEAFYLAAFYCGNVEQMRNREDVYADDAALAAGVLVDGEQMIIVSPFRSFWDALAELLNLIGGEPGVDVCSMRETLMIILAQINQNCDYFRVYGVVARDEMFSVLQVCDSTLELIVANQESKDIPLTAVVSEYLSDYLRPNVEEIYMDP